MRPSARLRSSRPKRWARTLRRATLAGVACLTLGANLAAQADGSDLPGYYQWYLKAGHDPRLAKESARDQAMQEGSDWDPKSIGRLAPDWSFPDAKGQLVPLRVGGEGRNTLVVTFQSWW